MRLRLISIEDYARIHKITVQEAHILVEEGNLFVSKSTHVSLRKLMLVYVDNVPKNIPSLDSSISYLAQDEIARKLNIPMNVLREKLKSGEIKSVRIKRFCFIPRNQFDRWEIHPQNKSL